MVATRANARHQAAIGVERTISIRRFFVDVP